MSSRRTSNARSKVRKAAQAEGFRSGFESAVAAQLREDGVSYEYETETFTYEVQETRKYTPDFKIGEVRIECKGRLTADDRKKLLLMKSQHPSLDLRLVFMYPNNKLTSRSKTRYWEWAEKNHFPWAGPQVPSEWLK